MIEAIDPVHVAAIRCLFFFLHEVHPLFPSVFLAVFFLFLSHRVLGGLFWFLVSKE